MRYDAAAAIDAVVAAMTVVNEHKVGIVVAQSRLFHIWPYFTFQYHIRNLDVSYAGKSVTFKIKSESDPIYTRYVL